MSLVSKFIKKAAPTYLKVMGVVVALFVAALLGTMAKNNASASPVSTPNCDANAVVWCGASSPSALLNDYNNGDGHNKAYTIQDIYHWFGIGPSDVSGMSGDVQTGYVTKSGDVYVGSTLVATNALTGGRQNIAGSTTEKYGATTFYSRPPSVSFLDDQLSAMVVMKNGVFQFAILTSCGNPVKATAVTKPAPKPTPAPTPAPKVISLVCEDLEASPGTPDSQGNVTYSFTGQAQADNVTIESYTFNFGNGQGSQTVNTSASTANATHTYAPGTYIASVTVMGTDVNGNTVNGESVNCSRTFTVSPVTTPQMSSIVCDELSPSAGTADSSGNVPYTFAASATPNNVTITSYVFNFGDTQSQSNTQTVNTSADSATANHSYAPGSYTATVVVNATKPDGSVTQSSCSAQISVPTPPKTCTTASGQTFPAGSAECTVTTSTTTLPNTGPGDVAGLFSGVSLSGAGVHRLVLNRKARRGLKK